MSYNKQKLADYLRSIFKHTDVDLTDLEKKRRHLILGGAGSGMVITPKGRAPVHFQVPDDAPPTMYVYDEGCDALDDFVSECMRDSEIELLVGRDGVLTHLQNLIVELRGQVTDEADYSEIIRDKILKPLREGIIEWDISVPVANLQLEHPVKVGKVEFIPHHIGYLANVALVMSHKGGDDLARQNSDKFAILSLVNQASATAKSWAVTKVRSHQARFKEVAAIEVEAAINVIRAFIHVFFPRSLKSAFGLPFDIAGGTTLFFGKAEPDNLSIQWDHRGTLAPIELMDTMIQRLRTDYCFDTLSQICGTPRSERTSMQQAVAVSNHWLGRSVVALAKEDAFTSCTIAIERLVILDGEETTVERFADRLTYLLSDDLEERRGIHRTAKRLYDLRSHIVHAGFVGISDSELAQMESFAIGALIRVSQMTSQMTKHEELREWLHTRKLA